MENYISAGKTSLAKILNVHSILALIAKTQSLTALQSVITNKHFRSTQVSTEIPLWNMVFMKITQESVFSFSEAISNQFQTGCFDRYAHVCSMSAFPSSDRKSES